MNGMTRRVSPLSTVERVTARNKTIPRSKRIRRSTPHCVAGNLSVETTLGLASFHDGKTASTGYAIGSDGRMGLGVEETNRPWTSSSSTNDNEAITFEIANDGGAPDWHMSDAAINKYLDTQVEACRFYGYNKVHYEVKPSTVGPFRDANGRERPLATVRAEVEAWIATWAKNDEMIITLHNWFANKACPGPYLMRQLPWLVREMNKRLQDPTWVPEAFVGEGATYPTLKQGSNGEEVKGAQQKLNLHGAVPTLSVDGSFGPLTASAVMTFQASKGLAADGIIGTATWTELNKTPAQSAISTTPSTPPTNEFAPYLVRLTASALNVRKGPGTNNQVVKTLVNDKNLYTIVAEETGQGSTKGWGKLKSGIGWISLDYTTKVK